MAATLPHSLAIAGLHAAPTIDELKEASNMYNQLPHAEAQEYIPNQHLQLVLAMIERHGMSQSLGVHLIHRHDQIGEDMLRVAVELTTRSGSWTKPCAIESLDVNKIHGHVLKLLPNERFVAYEYCEGSLPNSLAKADSPLFRELRTYLLDNDLANMIGLEVLHEDQQERMVEFEMNGGATVLVPELMANYGSLDRATGWTQRGKDGLADAEPDPGTYWGKTTTGKHKVFVDNVEPRDEEELVARLTAEGVLRA
ncbi:hypothetical protein QQZ08_010999 [Neonectria magnoliae]|uniref:Uncharacterized protein n=1 Tax=Neonectria magnoliae TaxID=2732573 RepID=A0ABR1HDD2_9HYPO